jgi:hypothetical protein
VRVAGNILGGHEILIRGLRAGHLVCDNSWSAGWGAKGSFLLPLAQWEILRRTQADVTIPQI